MADLTWEDLLRPHLHDPDVVITPGRYLAVAGGGGVTFNRDGGMKIEGAAMENMDILEIWALRSSQKDNFISLNLTGIGRNNVDHRYWAVWRSHMMTVAICDFHGILHNYKARFWSEDIYQRVQAALKEKYKDQPLPQRRDGVTGQKAKAKDFHLGGCATFTLGVFPLGLGIASGIIIGEAASSLTFCKANTLCLLTAGLRGSALGFAIGFAIIFLLLKFISGLRGFLYDLFHSLTSVGKRSTQQAVPGDHPTPHLSTMKQEPSPTSPVPQQPSSSPPAFELPAWPDPDQSAAPPVTPTQYSAPTPASPLPPAPAPTPPLVEHVRPQPISAPHSSDLPTRPSQTQIAPVESISDPYSSEAGVNLIQSGPRAELTAQQQAILQEIESVVMLMDNAFKIPVINRTVGIDPLMGMLWGFGGVASLFPAGYIIVRAATLGIPVEKLAAMLRNVLVDAAVGVVPVAGQVSDFIIKANTANLNIIYKHFGMPPYKKRR